MKKFGQNPRKVRLESPENALLYRGSKSIEAFIEPGSKNRPPLGEGSVFSRKKQKLPVLHLFLFDGRFSIPRQKEESPPKEKTPDAIAPPIPSILRFKARV